MKLGDALANAGRGAEAARAYLAGVPGASAAQALELRRRAAEQLLRSGHLDAGLAELRDVLGAVGLRLPRTPRRAILSVLPARTWLRIRGLGFHERDESEISAVDLTGIDICWSATSGLGFVDPVRAGNFRTRLSLLAFRAGEATRVARSLATEAIFASAAGSRGRRRADTLLRRAEELAKRTGKPMPLGQAATAAGVSAFLQGRWRDAQTHGEHAEAILRDCYPGAWELATARLFLLLALWLQGDFRTFAARAPSLVADARARGDLLAATSYECSNICWLLIDGPAGMRERIRTAMAGWTPTGFHLQHYYALRSSCKLDLYEGNGEAAWRRMTERWKALAGSGLLYVRHVNAEARQLRARCALAAYGATGDPALLALAERDGRALGRVSVAWAPGAGRLVNAAVALGRGRAGEAIASLAVAEADFEATDMAFYAAAARRRRGALIGGEEGAALVDSADARLLGRGIVDPTPLVGMLAPGFPD